MLSNYSFTKWNYENKEPQWHFLFFILICHRIFKTRLVAITIGVYMETVYCLWILNKCFIAYLVDGQELRRFDAVLRHYVISAEFVVRSWHYSPKQPRIKIGVLGHLLVLSLVRSHRSLFRLLRTAHFAHSLARGTVNDWMAILSVSVFFYFRP